MGADLAQGIELEFRNPTARVKLASGDTLVYPNSDRAMGYVLSAAPSDTVITKGHDKWRIEQASTTTWRVMGRVE